MGPEPRADPERRATVATPSTGRGSAIQLGFYAVYGGKGSVTLFLSRFYQPNRRAVTPKACRFTGDTPLVQRGGPSMAPAGFQPLPRAKRAVPSL